eukprot:1047582-Pyramimonas_sp.AAC.1
MSPMPPPPARFDSGFFLLYLQSATRCSRFARQPVHPLLKCGCSRVRVARAMGSEVPSVHLRA